MDIPTYLIKASLLMAVVLVLGRLLAASNPRWRMLLFELTGVGVLLMPAVALLPLRFDVPLATNAPLPIPAKGELHAPGPGKLERAGASLGEGFAVGESGPGPVSSGEGAHLDAFPLGTVLMLVYLVGFGVLGARQLRSARALRSELARLNPPGRATREVLAELSGQMGLRDAPEFLVTEEEVSPLVVGARRPRLVVPRRLTVPSQAGVLRMALRHELHHIRNRDLQRVAFLQAFVLLFWFHPLAWMLRRAHNLAVEELGDRVGAEESGRSHYSASLARLALDLRPQPGHPAAVGLFRSSQVVERLRRLRRPVAHQPLRAGRWLLAAGFGMLVLAVSGVGLAHPKHRAEGRKVASGQLSAEERALARRASRGVLDYLVAQQHQDGSFALVREGKRSQQTGLTALAGLAFHAHGGGEPGSPWHQPMLRCLTYVHARQDAEGYFQANADGTGGNLYHHCIATCLLATAGDPVESREAVSRAVKLLLEAQAVPKVPSARGGWRYVPTSADSDLSVTAWALRALHAAAEAGVEVPAVALEEGLAYVLRLQVESDGGFGYTAATSANVPRTGMGLYLLEWGGKGDSPEAARATAYILEHSHEASKSYPYYGLFWCRSALSQRGGADARLYLARVVRYCADTQNADGSFPGPNLVASLSAALALPAVE